MSLSAKHQTIDVEGHPLHIPEGINYSCSGCGRCCYGVAVPMTDEDYDRVSAIDFSKDLPQFDWSKQYRKLSDKERANTNYTHAIKSTVDGHCPFLINKLCHIHGKYGPEVKPLICGLFPYSFNRTPSGIYLTVSFRSNAVLGNIGTPLTEQLDTLKEKLHVYETVYDEGNIIWDQIKLATDKPLTWNAYLDLEDKMLEAFVEKSNIKDRMFAASEVLFKDLAPPKTAPDTVPNKMDKAFLAGLYALYLPSDPKLKNKDVHFNGMKFAAELMLKPPVFKYGKKSYTFESLAKFPWTDDVAVDDLLTRFIYSRIFGKWYFGGGFAQLSVVAGFHHLAMLVAIARLHSTAAAIDRGATAVSMLDVMETVRRLDEKIGVAVLDGYSAALWELVLFSPNRMHRVLDACFQ
ncbi:MAG TPA: YkgJ family cysteine cluster protein [Drouetiella sp.]